MTAKGYIIAIIKVHDVEKFNDYREAAIPLMEPYGGKFIAMGAPAADVRENANGVEKGSITAVFEYESIEKASAFYDSPEYQAVIGIRAPAEVAKSTFILVPGVEA